MTGAPAAGELIDEGTTIAVECVTAEENPTPQITWTRNGSNLDLETESVQNIEIEGENNANKKKSILTVQVCIFQHTIMYHNYCVYSGRSGLSQVKKQI